jgi:hypothetical protein
VKKGSSKKEARKDVGAVSISADSATHALAPPALSLVPNTLNPPLSPPRTSRPVLGTNRHLFPFNSRAPPLPYPEPPLPTGG